MYASTTDPNWFLDKVREFLTIFDSIAITLLNGIFKVFYLVATAEIISGDVIKVFYSRIQIILGVLMIFKLSMTVLNIIINPDSIKDQKQGASKVVVRVVVTLFLLTLIIPMNIPNAQSGTLNAYINDHGVLFGFLYKAQDAILSENILAKLILGSPSNNDMDVNSLSDVSTSMALSVLKVFVRINVKDESQPICDYKDEDDPCPNVVCPEEVNASGYAEENISPQSILDHISESCKPDGVNGERYAFVYTPIISAFVMIAMFLIILGFTLDIAVRAIKLMVLRLIAPIPIISYVDPKNEQKGAFGNWVKTLTSTYLDLFVRLAIVYFGLFIIQAVINGGLDIFGDGMGSQTRSFADSIAVDFAFVFILLGILVFMRQAPKFIRDMLGLQGPPMSNVGLSSVLGGTAAFLGGAGLAGAAAAAIDNYQAASEAAAQGKPTGLGWGTGRDLAAQIRTGDQKARGGIVNNARDRLMRNAGVNMARRYGVTGEGLEVAKDNMYAAQAAAAEAKETYERFRDGKITDAAELASLSAANGGATGEALRRALYNKQADTAKAAAKAESLYKEGKAFGDSHRVTPSFEEEHRRSAREMFGGGNPRPDMYNARGRGATSHQRISDRIMGSPDNWRNATGPNNQRTDNRWDPNGTRNVENNDIHDNPWGPPGPGGGGPGGPIPGGPGPRP